MKLANSVIARKNKKIKRFSLYRNHHLDQDIVVCGCGSSLKDFENPDDFITIGVNDVGRLFDPDYLVVLNPKNQFKGDRFNYVANSRTKALFTQLNLGIKHPNIVRFKLGQRGGTDCSGPDSLPFTRNSPYVALCLAIYMGAKRIGLIGVDFTEHHFFSRSGTHPLVRSLNKINQEYKALAIAAQKLGVQIVNLSEESRITAFTKQRLQDFYQGGLVNQVMPATRQRLKIVSYSTSPVAGVPEILARCINEKTAHECSCVWASNDYGNGVRFATAIEWKHKPVEAIQALREADVVIVHNGKVDARHRNILKHKPVITMAHNYLWNVEQDYIKKGFPGVVVGQYQATLPEFQEWIAVPNPLPTWAKEYQSGRKNPEITICYTPSGKHDAYPENHRLYWHSKGYATTMAILEKLAKHHPLKLEVIRAQQLSHQQVIAMKQRAHIVIDECVTGSYHRNSLEGLASACVVINGMGILPEVAGVFSHCAGNAPSPFIGCTLNQLETVLVELIESGRDYLIKSGEKNKVWMVKHWDFSNQWGKFWWPVIEQARAKTVRTASLEKRSRVKHKTAVEKKAVTRPGNVARKPSIAAKPVNGTSAIPVYWTCRNGRRGNFGDMLSPVLTRALSGRPAVFRKSTPRLFAVGSLLKFAEKGDRVWGAGFIGETDTAKQGIIIHAVRGPLTRGRLLAQGIDCPAIYGDPALLLPAIYPASTQVRRGIGIIPHYVDHARLKQAVKRLDVRVIDIRAGIDKVLHEAMCCEVLLCSSLHGCILADAYGIPNIWVELSDRVVGGGFKFRDYYASTEREAVCVNWRKAIDVDAAVRQALDAPKAKIDLVPLVKSFPYLSDNTKIFKELSLARDDSQPDSVATRHKACVSIAGQVEPDYSSVEAGNEPKPERQSKGETTKVPQSVHTRIAIFGAVTENYTEYMIATLRSFKKHNGNEDFDYFILGHAFSARTQRLINKYGIRYVNLNLKKDFARTHKHRYPGECFWIFKGPEIFYQRGYPYSVSVDGDILCNRKLDLDWLPRLKHLAGIDRGASVGEFLHNIGQLSVIKRKLRSEVMHTERRATNTGVLFYNNIELSRNGFYQLMVEAYQSSERAGIIRGGDDSSLALLLAFHADLKLHILENNWHVYRGLFKQPRGNTSIENELQKLRNDAYIIHLSSMKPWQHHSKFPNQVAQYYIDEWRKLWPTSRTQRRIKALNRVQTYRNNNLANAMQARKDRCIQPTNLPITIYWYRGAQLNIGDEITPYLLAKILGLSANDIQRAQKEPARIPGLVLVSIGSVLRLCNKNTLIWGSGIRNIDQPVANAHRFCAVRGPLTRRRLVELGYSCPEIYGDPALLLPRYYRPEVARRYALGIIPHLVDYDSIARMYKDEDDILIIDVRTADVESIVNQVLSCECTVSSSLHGIVLSIAYGIPTRWMKCTDKIMGDDTKFYDFFISLEPSLESAFSYKNVNFSADSEIYEKYRPLLVSDRKVAPGELMAATYTYELDLDLDSLIKAFPGDYFRCLKKSA